MKRLAVVIAALALAGPAAAESTAVALDDGQLDQVAAGCGEHGTVGTPTTTTQVIVSPIVVNQTAIAVNTQKAKINNGKGKGKGRIHQSGTALALNTVNINYHPKF